MAATATSAIHIPGIGIQLSKPTSHFTKAITFKGIVLESNLD